MATKSINLRDIPADLANKAKSAASLKGITLREFVIRAIELAIKKNYERD